MAALTEELSGDFVPECSRTKDSVGVTVQGVKVVVDSRELPGPIATLFHGEKVESQAHGRGRFVWIVRFHPD